MTSPATRSILLIVPENGLLFEAAGIADIFHQANEHRPAGTPPAYRLAVAGLQPHRVAHGRSGLNLLVDACLADLEPAGWDTIIVTGGREKADRDASADWLAAAAGHTRRLVSVCAGAFLLAHAGLLDGRRATTHWKAAPDLAREFPLIRVDPDPIYIHDGPVWTAAGASSGFDLALALVEDDLGDRVARLVAQYLVLYLRRPGGQSQFSRFLQAQASGGPIARVQSWALENLAADLRVEVLADQAAMSPRNFARVFTQQTGTTPAKFVDGLRLEAARQRLEQGTESLDEVAAACGYATALGLRRSFDRQLGVTPSEYRERFGTI